MKTEVSKIEVPLVELESIKPKKIFNQVTVHQDEYEMLTSMAKKSLVESKTAVELERDNHNLRKQITEHQKVQADQLRRINVLSEQKESHREESLRLKKENQKLTQERNVFKKLYELVKDWMKSKGLNIDFEKFEKRVEREEKQKDLQLEREQ